MSFPFKFVQSHGNHDFISRGINACCNAAVVAVGGISVGAIAFIALKALGFSGIAATMATAIPVAIGLIGVAGLVVGGCICIALLRGFRKDMDRSFGF